MRVETGSLACGDLWHIGLQVDWAEPLVLRSMLSFMSVWTFWDVAGKGVLVIAIMADGWGNGGNEGIRVSKRCIQAMDVGSVEGMKSWGSRLTSWWVGVGSVEGLKSWGSRLMIWWISIEVGVLWCVHEDWFIWIVRLT